jgi:hypothetical protein
MVYIREIAREFEIEGIEFWRGPGVGKELKQTLDSRITGLGGEVGMYKPEGIIGNISSEIDQFVEERSLDPVHPLLQK